MARALSPFFFVILSLFLFLYSRYSKALGDDEGFEEVELSTLRPANACSEWKAPSRNSLRVVHRFGPCTPSSNGRPDVAQILAQDSLRAAYLQSRTRISNAKSNMTMDPVEASLAVTLPARNGEYIGAYEYVVIVGIGTPKRVQTVGFDTGSDLCWVQCEPCQSCYPQAEPRFVSTASSTYHDVPCSHQACTRLPATRVLRGCTNNVCTYQAAYLDSSASSGLLAMERLELSVPRMQPIVLPNFVLGCGKSNRGFHGIAGIFGLGRGFHSLASQASVTLRNVFSYCLPSRTDISGYLVIGRRAAPSPMYTPMVSDPQRSDPGFYYIDLVGITVGRQRLQLSPSVFQNVCTIIDSGTMVTRLPPVAYRTLRDAFRGRMLDYELVMPQAAFDTCYVIQGPNVTIPRMTLHFNGLDLPLKRHHILYREEGTIHCLAFAASRTSGDRSIMGSIQQLGMEVIYDIQARRIGFSPGTNCR